jgi:hypothetical protein
MAKAVILMEVETAEKVVKEMVAVMVAAEAAAEAAAEVTEVEMVEYLKEWMRQTLLHDAAATDNNEKHSDT